MTHVLINFIFCRFVNINKTGPWIFVSTAAIIFLPYAAISLYSPANWFDRKEYFNNYERILLTISSENLL